MMGRFECMWVRRLVHIVRHCLERIISHRIFILKTEGNEIVQLRLMNSHRETRYKNILSRITVIARKVTGLTPQDL